MSPRAWYRPSDLDPPILKGKALGYSDQEIADALGVPLLLVLERIEANMPPKKAPLPVAVVNPKKLREAAKTRTDARYLAWKRARDAAAMARRAR